MHKKIEEFTFDDFFIQNDLSKYKVDFTPDSTVGSVIYEHLSSKPGFIRHKRSNKPSKEQEEIFLKAIHKVVSKGAPLEIFFTAFSPKIRNPHVTNYHVYPDMADLLTMIHLHLMAKGIREVYDYGFRFIIAYRGSVDKDFMGWTQENVDKTFEILIHFKEIAEKLVGIRNVVQLVDKKDLIKTEGERFVHRLNEEKRKVREQYTDNNPYIVRKIDAWMSDFRKALDLREFTSVEALESFLFDHAVYHRAVRNIEFTGGKHNLGICNSFPNVLLATIRGLDERMGFQLNPFFRFHSHQRLIVLSKEKKWNTMKWQEMQELNATYEPVYVEGIDYPFYFVEK